MDDPRFRLFACCVPVKGARRSVICDLQRQALSFIPNGLFEILTEHRDKSVAEIKLAYDHVYDREIDEYLDFLIREDLGFWTSDPAEFPDIDLTWESPDRITNAIIDVGAASEHNFHGICRELDDLGCKALHLRFFRSVSMQQLRAILAATNRGRLRTIEIMMPYREEISLRELELLCAEFQRISRLVLYSAPETRLERIEKLEVPIILREEELGSPVCCGEVNPGYFSVNVEMFTEARAFNTCLNRKLSIDEGGDIRNCPSLARSFGNIKETSLHAALLERDFQEWWAVRKDEVEVCKDCEFRYVCCDCRAYLDVPGNRYAKPAKCSYDPYSATWR